MHLWRGWVAREHARAMARARSGAYVGDMHRTVASGIARLAVAGAGPGVARAAVGALEVARVGTGHTGRTVNGGYTFIRADVRQWAPERVVIEVTARVAGCEAVNSSDGERPRMRSLWQVPIQSQERQRHRGYQVVTPASDLQSLEIAVVLEYIGRKDRNLVVVEFSESVTG